MRTVWITRAEPGASATAGRVCDLGFEPVVAPLIETRSLTTNLDLAGVAALAFTSAAGVGAFAALSPIRTLPAYAVGESTAQAARQAGFARVTSADGDVTALAGLIIADRARISGAVLQAGAASPAGSLVADLARAGVPAKFVVVYETAPTAPPRQVLDRIDSLGAVLIHSPSAGRRMAELLAGVAAPRLFAYCLSPAAGAPLEGLAIGRIVTAALPNEDALLSLLADHR